MVKDGWKEFFAQEECLPRIMEQVDALYANGVCYPKYEEIFQIFEVVDLKDVKVVILGQDPYHQKGQAHGFSFSVKKGVKVPPSLRNMYKEIYDDVGVLNGDCGYLLDWAKQGVFLLNTVLTVEDSKPKAHDGVGWQEFTDSVIRKINEKDTPVVFLLWGNDARKKKKLIDTNKHLVLEAAHPSPLSSYRGFFGCKHFSKCNAYLVANGLEPIDWSVKDV